MKKGEKYKIRNNRLDGTEFIEGEAKILKIERKVEQGKYLCEVEFTDGFTVDRFVNTKDLIHGLNKLKLKGK